jgi:putative colanic acid biosynthesis acetyltransferase WcaF
MRTNIEENRRHQRYSKAEYLGRILWTLAWPLFRFSPRILFGWRAFLLRIFGAKIGRHVHIYNSVDIYLPWNLVIEDWSALGERVRIYNLGTISIGKTVTVSQRAHLCAGTHDHSDPAMRLLKPPIHIADQAWICADAYVGPGVTVGEGALVAARAVVVKDVEPWQMVGGNPARGIGRRELRTDG